MANLNSFAFTGRLTSDAQIKNINGKTLVEMNVANNVGFGDYAKTNWLKVKWWGDRAGNAAPIFTKGSLISGQGEISLEEYDSKDGKHYANLTVTVFSLNLESKPKTSSTTDTTENDEGEDKSFAF